MSSSLIVLLEFGAVIGIVVGGAVWDLISLRRDRRNAQAEAGAPTRPPPA